jgi:hypothetical protein
MWETEELQVFEYRVRRIAIDMCNLASLLIEILEESEAQRAPAAGGEEHVGFGFFGCTSSGRHQLKITACALSATLSRISRGGHRGGARRRGAEALPELLRLAELEVRIPRMEVVALEKLAAWDGTSVDTVLSRELRDLLSAQWEWLAREIPGFAAALAWPY